MSAVETAGGERVGELVVSKALTDENRLFRRAGHRMMESGFCMAGEGPRRSLRASLSKGTFEVNQAFLEMPSKLPYPALVRKEQVPFPK